MCCLPCFCSIKIPKQIRWIPLIIILFLIYWLYKSFIFIVHPEIIIYDNILLVTGFHLSVFLLLISLYRCVRCNKSFYYSIKQKIDYVPIQLNKDTNTITKENENKIYLYESKFNGKERYCRKCNNIKPDRTHHCNTCERCILKMDHHCIYINNCIGFYNYKFFLLFLLWSSFACFLEGVIIYLYILEFHISNIFILLHRGNHFFTHPSIQIILVFLIAACLSIALFLFFGLHFIFVLRNYTTLEFCEKRRSSNYFNIYDLGTLKNIETVFGKWDQFYLWLFPIFTTSLDKRKEGTVFPVNNLINKLK